MTSKASGGHILVQALHAHGIDRIFCVAGESYLPVLDAILEFPSIEVITCRHESGATFMAETYAHLTGKPGVAFVTRGPGACNGSIGIHTARQSSAPVILFVGLINTMDREREAFQEFDVAQMFDSLSKWSSVIDKPERIADMVVRAMNTAMCGRPGPVVLGLPEEILTAELPAPAIKPVPATTIHPSPSQMEEVRAAVQKSKKPLILVGGSLWKDEDCAALAAFATRANLPVVSSLRTQDLFDHRHDSYIGDSGFGPNPALIERIKSADTILLLGARPDEITLQAYTLLQPGQTLIHVHPSAEEFGKNFTPDIAVQAHAGAFIKALSDMKLDGAAWKDWTAEGRKAYLAWTALPEKDAGWKGADMHQVFRQLRDLLPANAIITGDAGNFSGWAHRYIRFGRPGRSIAPVSGSMGFAVPSAVAASIAHKDRLALGICGDGGFMMTAQELATAAHHRVKPVIMVCNNSMYGTIRMHQERDYPGRISGTALTNPDFVKLAESYGAFGARVEKAEDFTGIWETALASGKAALIEIVMDPRQISTTTKP